MMSRKVQMFFLIWCLMQFCSSWVKADVVWFNGSTPVSYNVVGKASPVVYTALELFSEDMLAVTGQCPVKTRKGVICIREKSVGDDGFRIHTQNGVIMVEGNSDRGTAYAILELSRMAGVSPWVWWGDMVPEKVSTLVVDDDFDLQCSPSVRFRGIFINDEDWSLRQWSCLNYSPSSDGTISAKTYKRIFQLLLRLRANTIWPAMHEGTTPFFLTKDAKAVADSFGIVIGTSHCEPLLRNNVGEWDVGSRGAFNYRTNRQTVVDYWSERLKEVSHSSNNMFTIGMRGIHDGSMEGYKTDMEKFEGLQQVINDQQKLLSQYIGQPERLPQVFVPYKEVLQLYEMGLDVPDYVTLMWCDDNYGYITRLSNNTEQKRRGGGGVYYHLSYWGRPHDYLWLTTTQPGLIYYQMRQAYNHNVRNLWIANVHDPKVAGYDLELFLDMAWNIDAVTEMGVDRHLAHWLERNFGSTLGKRLFPIMSEFYNLCAMRRPEFMGWNQVELDKRLYDRGLGPVRNSEFNKNAFGNELEHYLYRYSAIASAVREIAEEVKPEMRDAFFTAIQYPVLAAEANAFKMLESQQARLLANGSLFDNDRQIDIHVAKSLKAYKEIKSLTEKYNEINNGKWRGLMCDHPRDLPFAGVPLLPKLISDYELSAFPDFDYVQESYVVDQKGYVARNAADFDSSSRDATIIPLLGHSSKAVAVEKGGWLKYHFTVESDGDYSILTALIPNHPFDNGDIRYSVCVDDGEPVTYSLKEPFRSEQWKLNVLRGQTLRRQNTFLSKGSHTITINAIDSNIVVDQWMVDNNPSRQFYLFPVK